MIASHAIDLGAPRTQRIGQQFTTAVTAKNGDATPGHAFIHHFRQGQQRLGIETLAGRDATGNAVRRQRLDRALPDCRRQQAGRPGAARQNDRQGVVNRIGADENGQLIIRQPRHGGNQRLRIGGW